MLYKTRQDKTRQDKTRQDNSYCWSNRQYGQAEPRQSKSDIRERSDLFLESPYKQRSTSDTKKIFKPYRVLNDYNGLCRTIKTQYFKNSVDNFLSKSSFEATGVIRKLEKDKSDRADG